MIDKMAVIAVYSLKGGVGKTTLAVNLAWCAATLSARRTLLWDLDPQAAASFLLGSDVAAKGQAKAVFAKDVAPETQVGATDVDRLSLLAADTSLRGLDRLLFALGKKKRLVRLLDALGQQYDRIILDCPPGLSEISEQVMRAADVIIVPVIPSPLSQRALADVIDHLNRHHKGHGAVLPLFSMVDRRRALHRDALASNPEWPIIPMASVVEQMALKRMPIGAYAVRSAATESFSALWRGIEKRLADNAG